MSGTFPTSPAFDSLDVRSIQPTFVSRTISGRRQARQIGGQYWIITATFAPLTRAQFQPIYAFVMSQRGRFDSFSLSLPVIKSGLGTPTGTPLGNGASQTGRTVVTDGWNNDTVVFKAGDFVKLSGNDKVYMITSDIQSNGSGQATLAIEPALVASPANDEAVVAENIPFTVALAGGVQEFATGTTGLFSYDVDFEEVL